MCSRHSSLSTHVDDGHTPVRYYRVGGLALVHCTPKRLHCFLQQNVHRRMLNNKFERPVPGTQHVCKAYFVTCINYYYSAGRWLKIPCMIWKDNEAWSWYTACLNSFQHTHTQICRSVDYTELNTISLFVRYSGALRCSTRFIYCIGFFKVGFRSDALLSKFPLRCPSGTVTMWPYLTFVYCHTVDEQMCMLQWMIRCVIKDDRVRCSTCAQLDAQLDARLVAQLDAQLVAQLDAQLVAQLVA